VRPGPPLPLDGNVMTVGWSSLITSLKDAKKYPETMKFLLLYFVYSDGYGTIAGTGILFASVEMCFPSAYLGVLVMEIPAVNSSSDPVWLIVK